MQVQAVVTAAVCLASGGWFLLLVLVLKPQNSGRLAGLFVGVFLVCEGAGLLWSAFGRSAVVCTLTWISLFPLAVLAGCLALMYGLELLESSTGASHQSVEFAVLRFVLSLLVCLWLVSLLLLIRRWTHRLASPVYLVWCCRRCGYDLRATLPRGSRTCPECGGQITASQARWAMRELTKRGLV